LLPISGVADASGIASFADLETSNLNVG